MQTDTLTFTSMSPTFAVDLIIGLPTIEGKMCAGKFDPANPHLTNCETTIAQNNLLDTKYFLHCSSKSSSPLFHYHRRVLYFPWNPWRCSRNLPLSPKTKWPPLTSSTPYHVTSLNVRHLPQGQPRHDTRGREFPRMRGMLKGIDGYLEYF